MKAILIEQNAFEEMHKNIQDVKLELAQIKRDFQSSAGNDILTVEQVRNMLKITRATLNNWHKEGILTKRYVGCRVYYKADEVYKLLDS